MYFNYLINKPLIMNKSLLKSNCMSVAVGVKLGMQDLSFESWFIYMLLWLD